MSELASWLETYSGELIVAGAETLAQNEQVKTEVLKAVQEFYRALIRAAQFYDPAPLYRVLYDWVETRTGIGGEDFSSLVPVIVRLKQATHALIVERTMPKEAIALLNDADSLFMDAVIFVTEVESEAVLAALRQRVQSAHQEIERLNQTKSDFIAIAAHELKTPLTVVEGYTGIMRSHPQTGEDETLLACVLGIEGGTKRLQEIIDDIVDVSLIDMQLLDLHFQPVWLHHVIDAVENAVGDFARQRNQTLTIDRDSIPAYPTFADSARLIQALRNIVMNAIKYTPDGGQVMIAGRELPGFVEITVEDTGIGIAADNLNYIFDAFSALSGSKLHSSGKAKFKGGGPGLGLPIARGIIEAHGGSIWAQSPGYDENTYPGSIFHILIPMRGEQPDPRSTGMFIRIGDD